MRLDLAVLAAVLIAAVVTYATRVAGIVLASRLSLSSRAQGAFDAIPASVLTAVIAPWRLQTAGPRRLQQR